MTIAKLPEQRQPHKKILDLLAAPVCEDLPFASEETLRLCLKVEDFEVVREALSDLDHEGLIISRDNPRFGKEYAFAEFKEQIEANESDYEALKTRVYAAAKRHGLLPKWREKDGWRLVDPSGETVINGNMRELEQYLDDLDEQAQKAAV